MSEEEEWVKTAMSKDSLVVEMLLRLNQAEPPPPPAPTSKNGGGGAGPLLQLEWSVRQRRSKQVPRKKGDATRASPTTPLSWSGATSVSGGAAEGFEESSKPSMPMENVRSKLVATGETTTHKRSRKKKTLAELKEEENLLLKEGRNLKNKLATLRLIFEKQRADNESLKRMKLDVLSHQTIEPASTSTSQETTMNQTHQMKVVHDASCMIMPANGVCNEEKQSQPNVSSEVQEGGSKGPSFILPDLNLPWDDHAGCGIFME